MEIYSYVNYKIWLSISTRLQNLLGVESLSHLHTNCLQTVVPWVARRVIYCSSSVEIRVKSLRIHG